MVDWSDVDCVILRRRMGEEGSVVALEGRVVEEGDVREQPIELPVAKVIDFIAQDGTFFTGREALGDIKLGGRLEVLEEEGGDQLRLRTVEGTDEKFYLESLPEYRESPDH